MTDFVSLHNQTHYSILDALSSPKELFSRAKGLGQSAIAITDHGTLAATWDSLKISKETGVKLIIGCELYFLNNVKDKDNKLRHIILLAKNAIGYKNLLTLNKLGFDNSELVGKRVYPIIDWSLLETHKEGLMCLTACGNGIISQLLMNKQFEDAEKAILKLKDIFGDSFGIEVQPNNMRRGSTFYNDEIDQTFLNRQLINLGKKHNVKVVAACNSHYINKEDHETHDVLLAIGSHQPVFSNYRIKYPVPDFYLKSGDEIKTFFTRNYGEEYAEELCANSIYFANLCEQPDWIDPKSSNPSGKELPDFPVKDEKNYPEFCEWLKNQDLVIQGLDEDKSYLRFICYNQLTTYLKTIPETEHNTYYDRTIYELETLEYQGFSSYVLIVSDYVNWCKQNDISIGPGRGSVAGCFLAFLLGIHKADSIKYGLIFERFQNKLRKAYPDIDQDISTNDREKLLMYLNNKYGGNHMCMISNYNTITPKVYLRDLARAMEFGGDRDSAVRIGNELAALIPNELGHITDIDVLIKKIPILDEYNKKYDAIRKHGAILGSPRAQSQHAAGVIISKRPLVGLTPIRKDKDNTWVIEYDKDVSEENGFVKMDILGLSTLDIISSTINEIKQSGKPFNNEHLNYEDNDLLTYKLISSGNTFGIFQFGTSAGTIDLCRRIKPQNIEDLAIITTLARPAASDIRNEFIETRAGKKEISLLHSSLEGAFKKTFGFGLFDESILQLGRDVAGWDYNEADRIRKMIKEKGKHPEKDKKLRSEFIESSIKNGINEILAPRIWDEELSKFASYTFNKSLCHSERIYVYTSNGKCLDAKSIENVNPGDFVKSREEKTGKDIFIEVKDKHDHGKLPLFEVELTTGEKVKCTMNHKFRVKENGEMLPLWRIIMEQLTIIVSTVEGNIKQET